eukprot:GHVU01172719.1.p1 GENE.GHVU01172719.1~~GHVU01172719.1.p1  ORF type:complete len:485 (+),score=86.62 GHVU01172719.1:34-1455(+)
MGATPVATRPNEVFHFDFLTVDTSTKGLKHILVAKDGFTGFTRLQFSRSAGMEEATKFVARWCLDYSPPEWLVSDGGPHFKNQLLTKLTEDYKIKHHITLAACPWTNGTAENAVAQVLKVMRMLRSTQKIERNADWDDLLPIIERRLNDLPYRGQDFTPRECFMNPSTGKRPEPIELAEPWILEEIEKEDANYPIDKQVWQDLIDAWSELHRKRSRQREQIDSRRDRKTYRQLPRLEVGDFVLVARAQHKEGEKLSVRWKGPMRIITTVSDFIYTVEDLVDHHKRDVHISRMKKYCDAARGKEELILPYAKAHADQYWVRELGPVVEDHGIWKMHVSWHGFQDEEGTLEPASAMARDVPLMFLDAIKEQWPNLPIKFRKMSRGLLHTQYHVKFDEMMPPQQPTAPNPQAEENEKKKEVGKDAKAQEGRMRRKSYKKKEQPAKEGKKEGPRKRGKQEGAWKRKSERLPVKKKKK